MVATSAIGGDANNLFRLDAELLHVALHYQRHMGSNVYLLLRGNVMARARLPFLPVASTFQRLTAYYGAFGDGENRNAYKKLYWTACYSTLVTLPSEIRETSAGKRHNQER